MENMWSALRFYERISSRNIHYAYYSKFSHWTYPSFGQQIDMIMGEWRHYLLINWGKKAPLCFNDEKRCWVFHFCPRLLTFHIWASESKYHERSFREGPNFLSEYPKSNPCAFYCFHLPCVEKMVNPPLC